MISTRGSCSGRPCALQSASHHGRQQCKATTPSRRAVGCPLCVQRRHTFGRPSPALGMPLRTPAKVSASSQHQPQTVRQHRQPYTETIKASFQSVQSKAASVAAALLLSVAMLTAPAGAADFAATGICLLGNCKGALAGCLADGTCLENLACLQRCNGRPDEAGCQARCADLYKNEAVDKFNTCAVSVNKCVPQRDDGDRAYPVPPEESLDKEFDLNMVTGTWFITAGLNPIFDDFDCQEHFFSVPEPGKLYVRINWRVPKGNDFVERNTVQTFEQRPDNPAILLNHDNDFLNYEDDWYILSSRPDEYYVVYYKGNNDAWKGYGGATVYTRDRQLPEKYIPEFREAVARAGLNWDDFQATDNSCRPHPFPNNLEASANPGTFTD
uniref:Chloroplast violaxanthin de-epoxidase n=1 Tax=Lobosphaera incisa TaxID=312850 RepID=A0A1Y0AWS2_9CHLO|nr:chloroplast violaxanthin de-epoxidase [Lobosphaera incisa]